MNEHTRRTGPRLEVVAISELYVLRVCVCLYVCVGRCLHNVQSMCLRACMHAQAAHFGSPRLSGAIVLLYRIAVFGSARG